MKILGLIPARGGSKALPGKNIRPIAGKSMIQRAFECASACREVDRVVLSTDDEQIASSAREIGLEVPFMRPAEFARDESPMIDVAVHALTALAAEGYTPDALLLLQPTSPLRRPGHVAQAVSLLGDNDSVCSVIEVPQEYSPHYVMKIGGSGYLEYFMPDGSRFTRRQDVPRAYKREGTIFFTRSSVLLDQRSFYGTRCVPMLIPVKESSNIDTLEDWNDVERRLEEADREHSAR